ncbi:MAG: GNAT family N-acetyltransferase [Clostridium paraputrificum]
MLDSVTIDKIMVAKLSDKNVDNLANFNCVDEEEVFLGFKNKQKKKFIEYSHNINYFIKNEALEEQEQNLNTTYILHNENKIFGFVSICADNIRLNMDEKKEEELKYASIPSLKIARLAVDKQYQHKGLGRLLIELAIYKALTARDIMGVKFITVDCYKHRETYYQQLGFIENKQINEGKPGDNPKSYRLNIDKYLENRKF